MTTISPVLHHHQSDPAYQAAQIATHRHQPAHSATTAVAAHPTVHVSVMVSLVVATESSLIVVVHGAATATTQVLAVHLMTSKRSQLQDVKALLFADSESTTSVHLQGVSFQSKRMGKRLFHSFTAIKPIAWAQNLRCHTRSCQPCSLIDITRRHD